MMRAFLFHAAYMLALSAVLVTAGCNRQQDSFEMSLNSVSWNGAKNSARQELSEIPFPSKKSYVSITEESHWQNPYLSVTPDMIQLRVYLADQNASSFDRGGLTRLNAARKQVLNVRLKDLPKALSSLPENAWPYGRVVAVGMALDAPKYRPILQHNLELTTQTLNDIGIVVDPLGEHALPQ